jgi:hypothetical protein
MMMATLFESNAMGAAPKACRFQNDPNGGGLARHIGVSLIILFLSACLIQGQAFARPYAPKLSCQRLKGMIYEKGAVVLSTGQFTFDRYVRDQGYCMQGEITEPAWLNSSDQVECFVGYTCGGRQPNYN